MSHITESQRHIISRRICSTIQRVEREFGKREQIYFMNGVHPHHNTIANYGWIKRGQTKQLKTNNGRKRININGALNLKTKEFFYVEY